MAVAKKRKYRTVSCHTTKTAAKKKQSSMHKAGKTAKVVEKAGKWCVASAGKRKNAGKKKTTSGKRKTTRKSR